jgi:hypothetical protein
MPPGDSTFDKNADNTNAEYPERLDAHTPPSWANKA